ncbi:Trafficking protein particle complex subunit 13 protein [Dioscorea alata]|uniref:Trafficking protein particle complex subunit 13 protein n=1 Tax=Dioscorea alata TaxID=55571 RepID=A0ACB7UUN5_DIOAL|nr:Trafficking protein particle complex subunit 13 protein [Dioscorea alata]
MISLLNMMSRNWGLTRLFALLCTTTATVSANICRNFSSLLWQTPSLFEQRYNLQFSENTFLEACIENHTKSNLHMDQVEFEPAPQWSATILKADEHSLERNSKTRDIFKPPVLIRAGGGIYNYLYQLKHASHESGHTRIDGSNILGKLQITWRTNLGESGRLQTQQILGTPVAHKDIDLRIVEVPAVVILERPFLLHLVLTSQTDKTVGPFEVFISERDSGEEKFVMVNGIQKLVLPPLESFGTTNFDMNMIATRLGVQRISGITIFDTKEKKAYDPLPDLEIFVDAV